MLVKQLTTSADEPACRRFYIHDQIV